MASIIATRFCSTKPSGSIDIARSFTNSRVQTLLKQLTRADVDKTFRWRVSSKNNVSRLRLMTTEELQKFRDQTLQRAVSRLAMPPFLPARNTTSEILAVDSEIAGFDRSKYMFLDVSLNVSERKKLAVVREPDGTLRAATGDEHDKLIRIFYEKTGRPVKIADAFRPEVLQVNFEAGRHAYILDFACVQFEPDDAIYVQTRNAAYDHLDHSRQYDVLQGTRHYGGFLFYLTINNRIDHLLLHFIRHKRLPDAVLLINLYHAVYPHCNSAQKFHEKQEPFDVVKNFIVHEAKEKGQLELALQSLRHALSQEKAIDHLTPMETQHDTRPNST